MRYLVIVFFIHQWMHLILYLLTSLFLAVIISNMNKIIINWIKNWNMFLQQEILSLKQCLLSLSVYLLLFFVTVNLCGTIWIHQLVIIQPICFMSLLSDHLCGTVFNHPWDDETKMTCLIGTPFKFTYYIRCMLYSKIRAHRKNKWFMHQRRISTSTTPDVDTILQAWWNFSSGEYFYSLVVSNYYREKGGGYVRFFMWLDVS